MMGNQQSKQRKWTDEHLEFIRQNVVNTEKDLQKMFNEKFGVNVSVSTIGNLKHYAGVKSGLIGGRFEWLFCTAAVVAAAQSGALYKPAAA